MAREERSTAGSARPDRADPTMARHMEPDQPEKQPVPGAVVGWVRDRTGGDREKLEKRPSLLEGSAPPGSGGPGSRRPAGPGTDDPDDGIPDPARDRLALSLTAAQILVADFIASRQSDPKRRDKMDNVIARLRETIDRELPQDAESDFDLRAYLHSVGERLAGNDRLAFLIELYFLDPFAPYTIKYPEKLRREALRLMAGVMGVDPGVIKRIRKTGDEALKSHSKRNWARVGLIGVGAAVVMGIGGFVAAPLLGAALGAGAGLAGAAATAHGLALLGGGALAAGGAGMAGGMWLVAGAGAALGAVAGGGGTRLFQLGADQARGELVKLQVTYKLTLLHGQADHAKAQAVVADLAAQAEELKQKVEEERQLNDENARRVKDLEETLEALEETIDWMRDQGDEAA